MQIAPNKVCKKSILGKILYSLSPENKCPDYIVISSLHYEEYRTYIKTILTHLRSGE